MPSLIFPKQEFEGRPVEDLSPEKYLAATHIMLLREATRMAVKSALKHNQAPLEKIDVPIGATVSSGGFITGRGYASDKKTGFPERHAEIEALNDAARNAENMPPDTLVSTYEPCGKCQKRLKKYDHITKVGFLLPRDYLAKLGHVKHRPSILEADNHYDAFMVHDPQSLEVNRLIFEEFMLRDPVSEQTIIDGDGLKKELLRFPTEIQEWVFAEAA